MLGGTKRVMSALRGSWGEAVRAESNSGFVSDDTKGQRPAWSWGSCLNGGTHVEQ